MNTEYYLLILFTSGTNWTPRSRSSDNIEKSPAIDRKSPLVKLETIDGPHSFISLDHSRQKISPSEDALSELNHKINNNGICKTPSRPRPWSVVGNESKGDTGTGNDSSHHTTPDELDNGNKSRFCRRLPSFRRKSKEK